VVNLLKKIHWAKLYFSFVIVAIFFIYGVLVGKYQLFPYQWINTAKDIVYDGSQAAVEIKKNIKHYTGIRPDKFIKPAPRQGESVITQNSQQVNPGVTFITSMWDNHHGAQLVDKDGTVLHQWNASFKELFPKSDKVSKENYSDWDIFIHGSHLYPDGSVLFNFEHGGIVKLDKCSNVVWKLLTDSHHSIHVDSEGFLWVPGNKTWWQDLARLPILKNPINEEFILKISPDGKILKEVSVLEIINKSSMNALLFSYQGDYSQTKGIDVTHVNDIEILEQNMASKFPMFKAGDLMVSMRNINTIAVIDPQSEKIKWSMTGPFLRQHDPDFRSDGMLTVFDNRDDLAGGKLFGGSKILAIEPISRQSKVLFEHNNNDPFFSDIGGKHQNLENGNVLVTAYQPGHVFEVNPSTKEVVWSYINRYNDEEVYNIPQAIRYPSNFKNFTLKSMSCPNN